MAIVHSKGPDMSSTIHTTEDGRQWEPVTPEAWDAAMVSQREILVVGGKIVFVRLFTRPRPEGWADYCHESHQEDPSAHDDGGPR